ncbi:oleandomycin transport system ATP-binding protein [Saccharopolyspora spinosa]|uniref:Oleandomycin transport system ATP-binding protein n=1 Tax=Saccharopolyspora spinosa TaxID=60894 RepID=A0A2N3XT52_SACSN|nr:oleandomycin transport system ATP-binding protein [Saccharopolyspora spinosa]
MSFAIHVKGLVKRFGSTTALAGVDLAVPAGTILGVPAGTILGVLGPNGAGKTTTGPHLATLLRPDAGTASVAGYDVLRQPVAVRSRIGLTGQYASVDEDLTGWLQAWVNVNPVTKLADTARPDDRRPGRRTADSHPDLDGGDHGGVLPAGDVGLPPLDVIKRRVQASGRYSKPNARTRPDQAVAVA